MLRALSELDKYALEASDGNVGKVADFLFDDATWKIRWLVADAGTWLKERKVLIHPAVIARIDEDHRRFQLSLTMARVKASPGIQTDEPVSRQIESRLHDHYGVDPYWDRSTFRAGAMALPYSSPPLVGGALQSPRVVEPFDAEPGDPALRSVAEVTGYHVHAEDGDIGHVENFLIDDPNWRIRYLVVDTMNWWPGRHVLVSPSAVRQIDWSERHISLNISRDQVKGSPPWSPNGNADDKEYDRRLQEYYNWPSHGY
jgi:hypothetical protein